MTFSDRIHDLKKRGVFRVGAVYIAVAFGVIQAVDLIFPRLGLPDWTVTAVIMLSLLGFPAALALAWAFDVKRDHGDVATAAARAPTAARRPPVLAFSIIVLPVMVFGAWYAFNRGEARELDANLVAVLPFRVAGAAGDLSYLREGMVDLLAAKLGGTHGVRAVDSRTVLAAWRSTVGNEQTDLAVDDAVDVGRAVHAGQLLLGEIVGTQRKMVVTASLVSVRTHKVTQASVEGAADDLPKLVDQLAAQLLALNSGEDARRLEVLVGTSLPAVRAYLQGRQAYRRGLYNDAIAYYKTALQHDSTFALAAFGLSRAGGWVNNAEQRRGNGIAWAHRDRLPPRDRVLFEATVSPRFPAAITGREWITGGQRAAALVADDPEAWYELGDALYHYGGVTGETNVIQRARDAFDAALELDSTYAAALGHATEVAAMLNDTAAVRSLSKRYLARDSVGETADLIRWLSAAVTNDEAALARAWQRQDSMAPLTRSWIAGLTQTRQIRIADAKRFEPLLDRDEIANPLWYFLNAGQSKRATSFAGYAKMPAHNITLGTLSAVLFGGLDSAAAPAVVRQLEPALRAPLPADTLELRTAVMSICALEQWRTLRGEAGTVASSIARLRSIGADDVPIPLVELAQDCATLLHAIAAVQANRPDARAAVDRLEHLLLQAPQTPVLRSEGNLVLARLLERLGEDQRALAALRRRSRLGLLTTIYLSTYLREEGRLAVKTGDLDGARRAYTHYLAIRPDPEPYARPEVDAVRRELAALGPDRR